METYGIYLGVLAAYGILFVLSHRFAKGQGIFDAAAEYLQGKWRGNAPFLSKEVVSMALKIFLAADILAMLAVWNAGEEDTAAKGYIFREENGGIETEQTLCLDRNGKKDSVRISLSPRDLTGREVEAALDRAEQALPKKVLGKQTAEDVRADLQLPDRIGDPEVAVVWSVDHPEYVDWDGKLTDQIPETGTDVKLTAELSLGEAVREMTMELTVYPRRLTADQKLEKTVNQEVKDRNHQTERKVRLPEQVEGQKAVWSSGKEEDGIRILALGLLAAFLWIYRAKKKKEDAEEDRGKYLGYDYPELVSRLVLLMNAGMSARMSLEQIAADFQRHLAAFPEQKKRTSADRKKNFLKHHPGFEAILKTVLRMRNGVTELEAYEQLGRDCRLPEYKTFSDILIRSSTKGGRELLRMLETEAEEAETQRRNRAKVLGEEAGTKLLLPMVLMLVVIMSVLMVPAILNFG
jgi:tight adherence protein C